MLLTQGFTIKGAPVLDGFLKVHSVFETATSASILTLPTLLVHLRLKSIHHVTHFNASMSYTNYCPNTMRTTIYASLTC